MIFVIRNSSDEQYYFNIITSNGQKLCTSGTYATKKSAKEAIKSIQTSADSAAIDDRT